MLDVIFNGKSQELFDTITVNTSLDDICGTFTLETTLKENSPINLGDLLTIKGSGEDISFGPINLIKGFIEEAKGDITSDSARVSFSGRDILGDLVDSSVPPEISLTKGKISLPELCAKVVRGLGISATIVNEVGFLSPFSEKDMKAVGFGGRAGAFLQSFARKRGVFLNTDGQGNLVIYAAPEGVAYPEKLTENSMLDRSFSYSDVDRFNKIEVGSEDNFAQKEVVDSDSAVDRRSMFEDVDVRPTRYLQIQAEESMSNKELEGKAQEEVNIRRARAFTFQCTVPTHKYEKGKKIQVDDKLSGVTGTFLIRTVSYIQSMEGNTSLLTLCFPETYSGVGKRITEKKSQMNKKPKKLGRVSDTDDTPRFFKGTFADPTPNYLGGGVYDG